MRLQVGAEAPSLVSSLPPGGVVDSSDNVVDTGAATSSSGNWGIEVSGVGTAEILNNTVRFRDATNSLAFGIGGTPGNSMSLRFVIENNLVWSTVDVPNTACLNLPLTSIDRLRNNNLFNCSSGNLSFVMTGAKTYFVDDATDFHLKDVNPMDPNSVTLAAGGLDLGSGRRDVEGATRTGNGTTGFSLGAYERDRPQD